MQLLIFLLVTTSVAFASNGWINVTLDPDHPDACESEAECTLECACDDSHGTRMHDCCATCALCRDGIWTQRTICADTCWASAEEFATLAEEATFISQVTRLVNIVIDSSV